MMEKMILATLGVEHTLGQHTTHCPAHDDGRQSLSVKVCDNGKVLLHCHAGCEYSEIIAALRTKADRSGSSAAVGNLSLATVPEEARPAELDLVTNSYIYTDEAGTPIYRVKRTKNKRFFQERWVHDGQLWVRGVEGVRRVLYRLPEVVDAVKDGRRVVIVEGEKDADRAVNEGLGVATTVSGGAGQKWLDEYTQTLSGAMEVVIIPDNDEPGGKMAERIADSLFGYVKRLLVLNLPGLEPKGDLSDWFDQGGTREALDALISQTPEHALALPPTERSDVLPDLEEILGCEYPLTDIGAAELFVLRYRDSYRYLADQKYWLCWDGKRWAHDERASIRDAAASVAKELILTLSLHSFREGTNEARWGRKVASASGLNAMISIASTVPELVTVTADLDTNPWLLNLMNGTFDIKTGELRDHSRDDLITKLAPVPWQPDRTEGAFANFVAEVLPDPELREFVQRAMGYSLTGSCREEVFFYLHGPAASGKTTLLEAVAGVLGDYAASASYKTFAKNNNTSGSAASPDVSRLNGRRFVRVSEIDSGEAFAESMLKSLTGGDTIVARGLYTAPIEFKAEFKIWFAANDRMYLRPDDVGSWRRLLQIPFLHSIPPERRDPNVKQQLLDLAVTGPEILKWCIDGAKKYLEMGLGRPDVIVQATDEYRDSLDPLIDFLDDACVLDYRLSTRSSVFFKEYRSWAEANGMRHALNARTLRTRLTARGLIYDKRREGRYWNGIGLRAELNDWEYLQILRERGDQNCS